MSATDADLMPFVLQLGRARASAMDAPTVVSSFCSVVAGVLGVSGVVIQLVDPPEGVRTLTASDARARWIGEVQQRAGTGPVSDAMHAWRAVYTADLRRIGPPTVAAAAAECGLVSSLAVPIEIDGAAVGVLQLVGEAGQPVDPSHADVLRRLLDVLAARLFDVRELQRAGTPGPSPAAQDVTVRPGPAVPAQRDAAAAGVATNGDHGMSRAPSAVVDRAVAQASLAVVERSPAADHGVAPVNGKAQVAPSQPGRRSRSPRGAHAAPDNANPTEETTRAIPSVAPDRSAAPRQRVPRSGKGRHAG